MLSQRGTSEIFGILAELPADLCPQPNECRWKIRGAMRCLRDEGTIGDCQVLNNIFLATDHIIPGLCDVCVHHVVRFGGLDAFKYERISGTYFS